MLYNAKILIGSLAFVGTVLGTNIHANKGCIDVNDGPLCAPGSVAIDGGAATIYAQFNSGNTNPTAVPGCELAATWPAGYGDIYFGADNCLYDSNSQVINGQCCVDGTGGTVAVVNPYAPS